MSNRFDDQNNIEMDIKTAFASWGKFVFKCFPQEGRLRSFLSEDSLDDSEEKNVDIINNPFIDSMVDRNNLLKAVKQIAEGEKDTASAKKYYNKIISDYPDSNQIGNARNALEGLKE